MFLELFSNVLTWAVLALLAFYAHAYLGRPKITWFAQRDIEWRQQVGDNSNRFSVIASTSRVVNRSPKIARNVILIFSSCPTHLDIQPVKDLGRKEENGRFIVSFDALGPKEELDVSWGHINSHCHLAAVSVDGHAAEQEYLFKYVRLMDCVVPYWLVSLSIGAFLYLSLSARGETMNMLLDFLSFNSQSE